MRQASEGSLLICIPSSSSINIRDFVENRTILSFLPHKKKEIKLRNEINYQD